MPSEQLPEISANVILKRLTYLSLNNQTLNYTK